MKIWGLDDEIEKIRLKQFSFKVSVFLCWCRCCKAMWSSTSSVAIAIAAPSSDEDPTESSSFSFSTALFNFSSGNPRIEETRGLMHLFPDETPATLPVSFYSSSIPSLFALSINQSVSISCQVGRKPLVCVVGVPNHMTYADFCQFSGSFIQHMLEMRIVRYATMLFSQSQSHHSNHRMLTSSFVFLSQDGWYGGSVQCLDSL